MKKYLMWTLLTAALGCSVETTDIGQEEIVAATQALTSAQRNSLIDAKRNANSWLGAASEAHVQLSPPGARRTYAGGRIYVGDVYGRAHVLRNGPILNKFLSAGAQAGPGYPEHDDTPSVEGTGRYSHYSNGWSIMLKNNASTAYGLSGCIRNTWAWMGWEMSPLGFPTSDQGSVTLSGGYVRQINRFDYGTMYEAPDGSSCSTKAWPVFTKNPRIPAVGYARVTSASLIPNQLGSYVNVTGSNFTPGQSVVIYVNNPRYMAHVKSVSVLADGTFSLSNAHINNSNILHIDGYVTVYAVQYDGLRSGVRVDTRGRGLAFAGAY